MAIQWEWSDKCGSMTIEQKQEDGSWVPFELSLYQGNCLLVMLWENPEDDTYQFHGFYSDEAHAKNCLGLNKKGGYTRNILENDFQRVTKIRLNKAKFDQYKAKNFKTLVSLFAQAFDNIVLEVVTE